MGTRKLTDRDAVVAAFKTAGISARGLIEAGTEPYPVTTPVVQAIMDEMTEFHSMLAALQDGDGSGRAIGDDEDVAQSGEDSPGLFGRAAQALGFGKRRGDSPAAVLNQFGDFLVYLAEPGLAGNSASDFRPLTHPIEFMAFRDLRVEGYSMDRLMSVDPSAFRRAAPLVERMKRLHSYLAHDRFESAREARRRLAAASVEESSSEAAPDAGDGLYYLSIPRSVATKAWLALRARVDASGLYPVFIGSPRMLEWPTVSFTAQETMREARTIDIGALLSSALSHHGRGFPRGEWIADYKGLHKPLFGEAQFDPAPDPLVALALVPARKSADCLANFIYREDERRTALMAACVRRLSANFGARLLCASENSVELLVANPPKDRGSALQAAQECWICFSGMAQGEYEVGIECDSLEAMATYLMKSTVWYFRWS